MTQIFNAAFSRYGLSQYDGLIHPERATIVDDPVNGPIRKVVRTEVHDADTGPTENPRCQLNGPPILEEGMEFYFGFSVLVPLDYPALKAGDWVTFGSVYGPPYTSSGPNGIGMGRESGKEVVTFSKSGGPALATWLLKRGQWMDYVMHLKLSPNPQVGFCELYIQDDETGWRAIPLSSNGTVLGTPGSVRYYQSTLKPGINDGGPNGANVTHYRGAGQWEAGALYHGHHRVATTFAEAAQGASYNLRQDLQQPVRMDHVTAIRHRDSSGKVHDIKEIRAKAGGVQSIIWP